MSSRSLKVAPQFIKQVKAAARRTGCPSQQALATELGLSRPTLSNFLNGRPVDYLNFLKISEKLGLDWQAIADREAERATLQQWLVQDMICLFSPLRQLFELFSII